MKTVHLRPTYRKHAGLLLISLIFVLGAIFLISDGQTIIGWFTLIFFGAGLLVSIAQYIPGVNGLKLDANGFQMATLGRKSRFEWSDILTIGVGSFGAGPSVVFETGKRGKLAETNRALAGADSALPDTYGMKAEELAALMTQYWQRWHETNAETQPPTLQNGN